MFALLGLLAGFLLGLGTLSGDEQGRVNLLFLLLVFAFLPVASLLLSLLFLVRSGGRGLSGWLLELPFWPRHLAAALMELEVQQSRKNWLLHQSQALALCFSLGTLFVFLLLLLGTDMSFVWRSTVLEAADLLPALQAISWPWRWWPEAQPSLVLLEQTRDYRLADSASGLSAAGQWWRFILAVQVCYSLLPRSLLWLYSGWRVSTSQSSVVSEFTAPAAAVANETAALRLADVVDKVNQPWMLLVWGAADENCIATIQSIYGKAEKTGKLEPLAPPPAAEMSVVVLVKSWEPPMAELADVLQQLSPKEQQFILPVDYSSGELKNLRPAHLAEWRRFAATLDSWQILHRDSP